jgi:hypothetical protein
MFAQPEEFSQEEQRPLQMPENYDFSQRKVNWKNYSKDFLLRTDAVWEKYKLAAYYYSVYKAVR